MKSFSLFLAIFLKISATNFKNNTFADVINGEIFDFIVGGGTAGCAVAGLLAKSGEYSVLIIESGGRPIRELDVPAFAIQFVLNPNFTTLYRTIPQINAAQADGGRARLFAAKTMGGGSAINGMVTNRGSPYDYDNWAKIVLDNTWRYENLLKYFRKYENYVGDNPTDQRGYYGPITVSRPHYAPGIFEWMEAGKELGYPLADPNGPQIESFSKIDYSQYNGRRVSSYNGYIEPLVYDNRGNLRVLYGTHANRIIFQGTRATGIRFTRENGTQGFVIAKKEIIISCGAIGSPAILMRSGIGPLTELDSNKISPINYLPVGTNLIDHVGVPNLMVFKNEAAAFNSTRDLTWENWQIYQGFGDGPYTTYLGFNGQAFVESLNANEKRLGWPNINLLPSNAVDVALYQPPLEILKGLQQGEVPVYWTTFLTRPKSRGTIILDKNNIDNSPIIDFRYFTHPDDMKRIVNGIKLTVKICEDTLAFRKFGCRFPSTPLDACSQFQFRSDLYWECYVRQLANSGQHAGGSCSMGSNHDAVVDNKLRVRGVKALRVVDASIMPVLTNANPQAAIYVIAEKGADMVLKEWAQYA